MVRTLLAKIFGWLGVAALLAGALLCTATGVLPERWQEAGVYFGVGLAFAAVGGTLVNLAISARPKWRGMATIGGGILAALPLLFVAWHNTHERPATAAPLPVSRSAVAAARSNAGAARRPEVSAALRSAPAGLTQLDPVLAEMSTVLKKQARVAVDEAALILRRGRARELPATAVRSQLSDTARELEEVRTSLKDIQSRHEELPLQLTSVVGDTTALDNLIGSLRWLTDLLENDVTGAETLAQPENEPQHVTAPVNEWLARCMQQIADLMPRAATAS
jgi:hypothetical protein